MKDVALGDIVLILVVCAIIWGIMALVNRSRRIRPANAPPIPDPGIGDPLVRHVLKANRVVAVVGSFRGGQDSGGRILRYLKQAGYTVYPVHPQALIVDSEPAFRDLKELPQPPEVLVVTLPAPEVPDWSRQAVEVGAKAVWIEKGSASPEGRRLAVEGGLAVVMDLSLEEEHARLGA